MQCLLLPEILAPLPLVYISIRLRRGDISRVTDQDSSSEPRSLLCKEEKVAFMYAKSIRTLQYLDIASYHVKTYWRVYRDWPQATLIGLHPGKRVRVRQLDEVDGKNAKRYFDYQL